MAKSKDIKNLIGKGNLRGEEIGRIIITDLVNAYRNLLTGKDKDGLLTEQEKQALINGIDNQRDGQVYNAYREVHEFLTTIPVRYECEKLRASSAFWKAYHIIRECTDAERELRSYKSNRVKYVSFEEYEELAANHKKEVATWGISVENLFFDTLSYYFSLYEAGEETFLDKLIEETKTLPLKRERIKENYWAQGHNGYYQYPDGTTSKDEDKDALMDYYRGRYANFTSGNAFTQNDKLSVVNILKTLQVQEDITKEQEKIKAAVFISDTRAPENTTMYDVLEYAAGFYSYAETDEPDGMFQFKEDYPAIYEAVMKFLKKQPFLKKAIGAVPESEYYSNHDAIKCQVLIDNDFLNFKEIYSCFYPDGYRAYAIIPEKSEVYKSEPSTVWIEHNLTDKRFFEDNMAEIVEDALDKMKEAYREMYVIYVFLALTAEFVGVDDLDILIDPINEDFISAMNNAMETLIDEISPSRLTPDGMSSNEIREKLLSVLLPIRISDLQPSVDDVIKAKQKLSLDTFKGGAVEFMASLKNGGIA